MSYTLVNDISRYFCQAVYIRFTGTVVTSLYSIIEKAIVGVAIPHIVFSSIDTSLSSNRVCTARRILVGKSLHIVPKFSKGSCSRASCKPCPYYDNIYITLVSRVYKVDMVFIFCPFVRKWTFRYFGI